MIALMQRFLKTALAVVIVLLTPITSAGVMLGAFLFLPLPADLPERVPPSPSQISRVYDAAGNEIGTFKQFETSIPVEPEDIPEHLKQAVIAAEDRSFYSHGGVDVRGTHAGARGRRPQPRGRARAARRSPSSS